MLRFRLVVGTVATLIAVPALAQERIELFTTTDIAQTRMVDADATVRGFGDVFAVTPLTHVPTEYLNRAAAVSGGRYVAWLAQSVNQPGADLFLFDRRSRTVSTATGLLPPSPNYFSLLGADTHRPRLFVLEHNFSGPGPSQIVWTIDLRGGPPVALATLTSGFQASAMRASPTRCSSTTRLGPARRFGSSTRRPARRCDASPDRSRRMEP